MAAEGQDMEPEEREKHETLVEDGDLQTSGSEASRDSAPAAQKMQREAKDLSRSPAGHAHGADDHGGAAAQGKMEMNGHEGAVARRDGEEEEKVKEKEERTVQGGEEESGENGEDVQGRIHMESVENEGVKEKEERREGEGDGLREGKEGVVECGEASEEKMEEDGNEMKEEVNVIESDPNASETLGNPAEGEQSAAGGEQSAAEGEQIAAEGEQNVGEGELNVGEVEQNVGEVEQNVGEVEQNTVNVEQDTVEVEQRDVEMEHSGEIAGALGEEEVNSAEVNAPPTESDAALGLDGAAEEQVSSQANEDSSQGQLHEAGDNILSGAEDPANAMEADLTEQETSQPELTRNMEIGTETDQTMTDALDSTNQTNAIVTGMVGDGCETEENNMEIDSDGPSEVEKPETSQESQSEKSPTDVVTEVKDALEGESSPRGSAFSPRRKSLDVVRNGGNLTRSESLIVSRQMDRNEEMYNRAQVLHFIAQFLELYTPCEETVKALRKDVVSHDLLPQVVSWNGSLRPGTLEDVVWRFGDMSRNRGVIENIISAVHKNASKKETLSKNKRIDLSNQLIDIRTRCRVLESERRSLTRKHELECQSSSSSSSRPVPEPRRITFLKAEISKLKASAAQIREKLIRHMPPTRPQSGFDSRKTISQGTLFRNMKFLKKTQGHFLFVFCVCVDPLGEYIITGSDDTLIKLWSAQTGELLRTLRGHSHNVCDLRLKRVDGRSVILASASDDRTIRLWEIPSGKALCVLKGHTKGIEAIRFDIHSGLLYSGSNDGSCCIWDTDRIYNTSIIRCEATTPEDRKPIVLPHVCQTSAQTLEVNSVSVHPSGSIIATGDSGGTVRLWYAGKNMSAEIAARCQAALIPASPPVNGSYQNGSKRLINILRTNFNTISSVLWSNDGYRLLATSSVDGTVRVFEWKHTTKFADLGLSASFLFEYPKSSFTLSTRLEEPLKGMGATRQSSSTTVSSSSMIDVSETVDVMLSSSSTSGTEEVPKLKKSKKTPTLDACTWSTDDRFIITAQCVAPAQTRNVRAFWDQQIRVWDTRAGGQLVHVLRKHRGTCHVLVPHPTDPKLCLSAGWDGQILVWDIVEGTLINENLGVHSNGIVHVLDVGFLPYGKTGSDVVCSDSMGRLCFLGTGEGRDYNATPPSQFFANDRAELVYDDNGNAMDSVAHLPPHLVPRAPLCDAQLVPYDMQPGQGTYTERCRVVKMLENVLRTKEKAALDEFKEILEFQDSLIHDRIKGIKRAPVYRDDIEDNGHAGAEQATAAVPAPARTNRANTPTVPQTVTIANRTPRAPVATFTPQTTQSQEEKSDEDVNTPFDSVGMNYMGETTGMDEMDDDELDALRSNAASPAGTMPPSPGTGDGAGRSRRRAAQRAENRIRDVSDYINDSGNGRTATPPPLGGEQTGLGGLPPGNDEPLPDDLATRADLEWSRLCNLMDRKWISENPEMPQLGDFIIYNMQAHMDAIEEVFQQRCSMYWTQLSQLPHLFVPWEDALIKQEGWPFVLGLVKDIKFHFPYQRKSLRAEVEPGKDALYVTEYHTKSSIMIEVILQVISAPPASSIQTGMVPRSGQWERVSPDEPLFLQILFPKPLKSYGDVFIFRERFDSCTQHDFPPGCSVVTRTGHEGQVVQVTPYSAQRWPHSPHKAVHVRLLSTGQVLQLSPWQLRRADLNLVPWELYPTGLEYHLAEAVGDALGDLASQNPHAVIFKEPVNTHVFQAYLTYIAMPTDLGTISAKLKGGFYRSIHQVLADILLVKENCFTFNPAGTPIRRQANAVLKLAYQAVLGNIPVTHIPAAFNREHGNLTKFVLTKGRKARKTPVLSVSKDMLSTNLKRKKQMVQSSFSEVVASSVSVPTPSATPSDTAPRPRQQRGRKTVMRQASSSLAWDPEVDGMNDADDDMWYEEEEQLDDDVDEFGRSGSPQKKRQRGKAKATKARPRSKAAVGGSGPRSKGKAKASTAAMVGGIGEEMSNPALTASSQVPSMSIPLHGFLQNTQGIAPMQALLQAQMQTAPSSSSGINTGNMYGLPDPSNMISASTSNPAPAPAPAPARQRAKSRPASRSPVASSSQGFNPGIAAMNAAESLQPSALSSAMQPPMAAAPSAPAAAKPKRSRSRAKPQQSKSQTEQSPLSQNPQMPQSTGDYGMYSQSQPMIGGPGNTGFNAQMFSSSSAAQSNQQFQAQQQQTQQFSQDQQQQSYMQSLSGNMSNGMDNGSSNMYSQQMNQYWGNQPNYYSNLMSTASNPTSSTNEGYSQQQLQQVGNPRTAGNASRTPSRANSGKGKGSGGGSKRKASEPSGNKGGDGQSKRTKSSMSIPVPTPTPPPASTQGYYNMSPQSNLYSYGTEGLGGYDPQYSSYSMMQQDQGQSNQQGGSMGYMGYNNAYNYYDPSQDNGNLQQQQKHS